MPPLLLACELLGVFLASAGFAWLVVSRRLKVEPPEPETLVLLRSVSGTHRSHFKREEYGVWIFAAPLESGSRVLFSVHEPLLVEIGSSRGALVFRSAIATRSASRGEIGLFRPKSISRRERRTNPRLRLPDTAVALDGARAWVADVSRSGARLDATSPVRRGDRVRVDLPWRQDPVFGWVLDSGIDARDGARCSARVMFEDEVDLPHE